MDESHNELIDGAFCRRRTPSRYQSGPSKDQASRWIMWTSAILQLHASHISCRELLTSTVQHTLVSCRWRGGERDRLTETVIAAAKRELVEPSAACILCPHSIRGRFAI